MRAVYVPTRVVPAGAAVLVATAPATDGGGELLLYPAERRAPRRTKLTAEELQGVLRQWAAGVRAGQGRLRVGD
jgi:hypothetical protein